MPPAQFSHIDLRCPLFIPGNRSDMLGKADGTRHRRSCRTC